MKNISFIKTPDMLTGEEIEHAIIDHGNGEFTSMLKSTYDEMIANQSLEPSQ
jgi:hypothetical protein